MLCSKLFKHNFSTSMMSSRSYQDAVATLNSLQTNFANIQKIRETGNKNTATLLQTVEFSKRIGYDPIKYDRMNMVHVTGTKGKGSTCAFIYSLLSQYRGSKIKKIGLYTSPHLRSVRERICIDGSPISEELFAKYFFEVYDKLEASENDSSVTTSLTKGVKPGYFKFLTLLSFYVFMKENVDTAIFEVGIGGELDCTNIIVNPVVCGVSSIAIDHTFVLGNTVEEISWNKSGIFKKGSAAFSVSQKSGSEKVLKERAAEKGSTIDFVDVNPLLRKGDVELGVKGDIQLINSSLALAMTFHFLKKVGVQIFPDKSNDDINSLKDINSLSQKMLDGLKLAHIDGRSQILKSAAFDNLTWYIDGSHTLESINRSSNWWKSVMEAEKAENLERFNSSVKILLFNQQSRSVEELLSELYNVLKDTVTFDHAIFSTNVTWANNKYDINLVSMNVDEKKIDDLEMQRRCETHYKLLQKTGSTSIHVYHDIETSANLVHEIAEKNKERDVDVFVCGSLHLAGGLLVVLGQ